MMHIVYHNDLITYLCLNRTASLFNFPAAEWTLLKHRHHPYPHSLQESSTRFKASSLIKNLT